MAKYLLIARDQEELLAECDTKEELNERIKEFSQFDQYTPVFELRYELHELRVYEIKDIFDVKVAAEPFYLDKVPVLMRF